MSIEHVKYFYDRLTSDEDFRTQIQNVNSKEECSQIVQAAGYDFTQEELEDYTAQLLESVDTENELQDLGEKELAAVVGGAIKPIFLEPIIQPMYGIIRWPWPPVQQLYGVVVDDSQLL